MKKNIKNVGIVVILCLILLILIINSESALLEFQNNTKLFFYKLFPSTFLFLILSHILLDYLPKVIKTKSMYFYILLLSLVSGFPSGSIIIKECLEKEIINEHQANKMMYYAHFPNPIFVIFNLKMIVNNSFLSYSILLSILLSNLIIYLGIKKEKTQLIEKEYSLSFSNSLYHAIEKTTHTIFLIYGVSMIFSELAFFINKSNNIYLFVLINGLLDLTKGVSSLSLISNVYIRSYLIIFFISFTSFSIHFQTKSILDNTKIQYKNYLKGRISSFLLSFLFFTIILLLSQCL